MTQKNEMSARALAMDELEMVNGGGFTPCPQRERTPWLPEEPLVI